MRYRHFLLCLTLLVSAGCANQPALQIATPDSNGLDGDEEQAILSYHNEARAGVNVQPLHWSAELAQQAATRGATLAAKGCKLQHNKDSKYGENLFMTSSHQNHDAVIDAVESWGSEKKNYTGQALTKANVSAIGHYTQMVWSVSSELGCAKVSCNNQFIVICHYSPVGNQLGAKPY